MAENEQNNVIPDSEPSDCEVQPAERGQEQPAVKTPRVRLFHLKQWNHSLSGAAKAGIALAVLYVLGCAVRIFLLQYVSPNPYIAPDEPLYMNLARALWNGEGVQLRGQPVTFKAILFPLIMSPLYALPAGSDIFGIGQIVETLIMSCAVFPAYALARKFQCSRRNALLVSVFSLLLPDMFMATRWMTEALTYPLLLLSLLLCARFLEKTNLVNMAFAVLSCFALYLSKEGGAGIIVALIVIVFWRSIRNKSRDDVLYGVGCTASYVVLWLAWLMLLRKMGVNFSTPSIYETQTQGLTLLHLLKTSMGLSLYALFTAVGFGVLPLLLPFSLADRFDSRERWLLRLVLMALFIYVAGTCYVIYVDEIRTDAYVSRIHLRYLFPFIPVMLGALFSRHMKGAKFNTRLAIVFSTFVALLLTYGLKAFGSRSNFCIDALLLSFLSFTTKLLNAEYTLQIVLLAGCGAAAWWLFTHGWEKRIGAVFCVLFGLQLLIANYTGYETNHYSTSEELAADSRQVSELLQEHSVMLVSDKQNGTFDSQLISLDGALTKTPVLGLLHDVCGQYEELQETGSIQLPPYWVAGESGKTPVLDTIVLNNYSLNYMRLSKDVETEYTDNKYFVMITLPENGYWLHSTLCGLVDSSKVSDDSAFWLFDEELLKYPFIRIKLSASAGTDDGTLAASFGDQITNKKIGSSRTEMEIVLKLPGDGKPVRVDLRGSGEVEVHSYTVAGLNSKP